VAGITPWVLTAELSWDEVTTPSPEPPAGASEQGKEERCTGGGMELGPACPVTLGVELRARASVYLSIKKGK
jgi:hypothetical protein